MAKVILFDIDGTLVLTGGAGWRAMVRAFEDIFAVPDAFQDVPMMGRTDFGILTDAATRHGLSADADTHARLRDIYLSHLRREIHEPGPRKGVMPGVRPLLDRLASRDDVYLALLTGNFEQSARLKLEFFDLWRYFRCGAYGDGAPERNPLLPQALETIRSCGGPAVHPSETVVVGDTPLDVACAAASGARSVAVATGSYDVGALRDSGADVVLEDLSDTEAALRALEIEP